VPTEIKVDGGEQHALYTHAYVTWETAVEVVCKLAAQYGRDNVFSTYDAERLLQAAGNIIKGKTALGKEEIGWQNANPATGMTPNIWVEQDPRDKAKNLLKRL